MALICTTVQRVSDLMASSPASMSRSPSASPQAPRPPCPAGTPYESGVGFEVESILFPDGIEPDDAPGALTVNEMAGSTCWFHSRAGYAAASEAAYCEAHLG